MSKVGKAPITIPEDIEVTVGRDFVRAKNNEGREAEQKYDPAYVEADQKDGTIKFTRKGNSKPYRERHGLYRSLVANMIEGLGEPFEKQLEIEGLGYRARAQGNKLVLELGFSHPIEYELPEGIDAEVEDGTQITITGFDKQEVGQVAADVRSLRPPEPYKGKGIRYKGEHIIRKEGKLSGGEEAGLGS